MIIVFIIVLNTVIIPNGKYNDALYVMDAGKLDKAYRIFNELGDYKDAADKAGNIRLTKTKEQLKNINGGAITSAMLNAISKAVNTLYELGRQTGSALKRLIKNKHCAIR